MLSLIDPRFECSICLNCLKDPMLTRCGHRFCSECISTWLERKSQICPIDLLPLTIEGLFPDNYTKREIDEQKVTCLNTGCDVIIPLLEADQHYASCVFNKNKVNGPADNLCPFHLIGCKDTIKDKNELSNHLVMSVHRHVTLLTKSHIDFMNKFQIRDGAHSKALEATQLWDANKDPNSEKALLCNLYERIVVLEQSNIEKDKDIERLNQKNAVKDKDIEQLSQMVNNLIAEFGQSQNAISLITCNGVYIWRFENFMESLKSMRERPSQTRYYTPGFYTSSTGYKVCGRINMSTDNRNLSLFIHMMRGEYDDTLIWPFSGHITLFLIHPTNPMQTICLKMQSSAESEAFRRCSFGNISNEVPPLNPRAFGYHEFVAIDEILQNGFIKNDSIVIKIIVKCT
ncbi:PREDICTED: TNF receptor-associated factor 6-like [Diuraphis noxia]|uniref:TNF receptor-associated factor 6-like n=1 Tax=Diuraphis noxia TaxID=143948 RepID=UPI0007635918|nr:PREDICTED: TNF receptor-associated factor 6-like [Diuraphis noxia]XP_015368908.1 PREDICTED: TNF receptor-associated factor 6-like [Diuraphis noxia]XP_015368909.1 PREDICTED: TNF receptor-associated factor 6-like [Diuraphis noxia]